MNTDLADFPLRRRRRTDILFGALGRALALAQHFEQNCQKLAALVGMIDGTFSLENPDAVHKITDSLRRRPLGSHVNKVSGHFPKTADQANFTTNLDNGRVARNWLAHDAALRVQRVVTTEDERRRFLFALEDAVYALWKADFSVAHMIGVLSNDVGRDEPRQFMPSAVRNWVYERFPYKTRTSSTGNDA